MSASTSTTVAATTKGGVVVVTREQTNAALPNIPPVESSFTKPATVVGKPKKLYVAVNPFSGNKKGLKVLNIVKPIFEEAGVELDIRHTERSRHITEMAATFDFAGYDGFAIIGGDGSLNEFLNGLLNRKDKKTLPIAVIPGGTGNSFAQDLGFSDAKTAATNICLGRLQSVDVGKVTLGHKDGAADAPAEVVWGVNIASWPAESLITAEKLRCMGPKRYELGGVWQILTNRMGKECRLEIDGETIESYLMLVHIQNNQYTGKMIRAAPYAKLDDGRFDVVLGGKMGKLEFLGLVGGKIQSGEWVNNKNVEYRQFKTLKVTSTGKDKNRPVNIDGELAGVDPMTLEVVPGAIKVFA